MRSVTFGNHNSYDNFHLILKSAVIPKPEQRRSSVTVPGRHGKLDMTYFLSEEPVYENIEVSFTFAILRRFHTNWDEAMSTIANAIHGHDLDIHLSWIEGWHLTGNVQLSSSSLDAAIGELTITCDCSPWFYKDTLTRQTFTITSSSRTLTLENSRKWCLPTFRSTSSMSLLFNSHLYSLEANTDTVFDSLVLKDGSSTINVTEGTGTLIISYQEARL